MNKKKLNELNKFLKSGLIPDELNFSNEFFLDWSKLQYTNLYDNPAYIISKLPSHFMNLPGADEIVRQMIIDMNRCKVETIEELIADIEIKD